MPRLIILPVVLFFLSSCVYTSSEFVDDRDLMRSLFYTQQQIIAQEFGRRAPTESTVVSKRAQLLWLSYCDLLDRQYLKIDDRPKRCDIHAKQLSQQGLTTHCMTRFHQCIAQCRELQDRCTPCETTALKCVSAKSHSP